MLAATSTVPFLPALHGEALEEEVRWWRHGRPKGKATCLSRGPLAGLHRCTAWLGCAHPHLAGNWSVLGVWCQSTSDCAEQYQI